jgi:hypothetical protein
MSLAIDLLRLIQEGAMIARHAGKLAVALKTNRARRHTGRADYAFANPSPELCG